MIKCVLILVCCLLLSSVESFASDSNDSYLKTSVGAGMNYGGTVGLNNEFVVNEYISLQQGIGYSNQTNVGVVAGASVYPLKNDQHFFNPRLTVLYGRVGKVEYGDGSYKRANGYAIGAGVDYPFAGSKKWSAGLDLFYAAITDPIRNDGDVVMAFGVGYSFK